MGMSTKINGESYPRLWDPIYDVVMEKSRPVCPHTRESYRISKAALLAEDCEPITHEECDAALVQKHRRLALVTADLAEDCAHEARAYRNIDRKSFYGRTACLTKAVWAHSIANRLRLGKAVFVAMPDHMANDTAAQRKAVIRAVRDHQATKKKTPHKDGKAGPAPVPSESSPTSPSTVLNAPTPTQAGRKNPPAQTNAAQSPSPQHGQTVLSTGPQRRTKNRRASLLSAASPVTNDFVDEPVGSIAAEYRVKTPIDPP